MLEAVDITVRYGTDRPAVERASVSVDGGEVVVLCGPNGAGKSTLLSVLAGDTRPDDGEARLHGRDIRTMSARELSSSRAVLEQSPKLAVAFTVAELAGLSIDKSVPPDNASEIVSGVLEDVGLADVAEKSATKLSGGQRHRTHLARALAQLRSSTSRRTGFLLLDEPTASLDLAHQVTVCRVIEQASQEGCGVLMVCHDLNLAAAVADRIVLMHRGQVVRDAPPRETLEQQLLGEVYQAEIDINLGPRGEIRINPNYLSFKQEEKSCSSQ